MIDDSLSVRASKAGHHFHEQWAARVALRLLHPGETLKSITLEGLRVDDAVGKAATEVADLTQYFDLASGEERVVVSQFKYSPTQKSAPLTASDLSDTLRKFASTYSDFHKAKGEAWTSKHLNFEFVSNRPVGANLRAAMRNIYAGQEVKGPVRQQQRTLFAAFGSDSSGAAAVLLDRLSIIGQGTSVRSLKTETSKAISAWFGASGPLARKGFLELCSLIVDKTSVDASNNVVSKEDVLGCFGIDDESELFPVAQAFPDVNNVLERQCFDDFEEHVRKTPGPLLIHGAGGSGKTVVVQALARRLASDSVVVLFDGFGGGRWRMPGDDRHQCRRSLLHIVNELAARGLCDLMLPGMDDDTALRTAHKRLKQAAENWRVVSPWGRIYLLLDAIDHAGIQAAARREDSFARLLIERIAADPIEGVMVVASCRTERIHLAIGDAKVENMPVPPMSKDEGASLAVSIDASITSIEVHTVFTRSRGNPRCLSVLVAGGRPFDVGEAEGSTAGDVLDALLLEQFDRAIRVAVERGSSSDRVDRLLHSVALLPPPVPLEELSQAIGYPVGEIESFFSDLFPFIETTPFGLIFRDEPTETLAIKLAVADPLTLDEVIENLRSRQDVSSYATLALPGMLLHHGRLDELVGLAFSDSFPPALTSSVAKRGVRLSRLGAAAVASAKSTRTDDLFSVLVEAARVSGGSARADRLVMDFPDLTALSGDSEALRRLFDRKGSWAGPRFAAMAIANTFSGDAAEADRNANRAVSWLNWSLHQTGGAKTVSKRDWVRTLLVFTLGGQAAKVIKWISQKEPYEAYAFLAALMRLIEQSAAVDGRAGAARQELLDLAAGRRKQPAWFHAAILEALRPPPTLQRKIIKRLCADLKPLPPDPTERWDVRRRAESDLVDACLGAALIATQLGMFAQARSLLMALPIGRPSNYELDESYFYDKKIGRWIVSRAIGSLLSGKPIGFSDTVPAELWDKVPASVLRRGGHAIEAKCRDLLQPRQGKSKRKPVFDHEVAQRLERTLANRSTVVGSLATLVVETIGGQKKVGYALDAVKDHMISARDYPYRDGAAFVAEHAIASVLFVADRLELWDTESASIAMAWIQEVPRKSPEKLVALVGSFARLERLHPQALQLAGVAREFIRSESEAEPRIQNLALLANKLWSVSEHEAGARFRDALELADAMGSDSQDAINVFIGLLGHYEGPSLSSETVHNIARLCELNLPYDTDKFDWDGLAKGLSRVSDFASIAILTRWVDRGKLTLGWALTPFLTFLLERKKISPVSAAALLGADEVAESWYWSVADYADVVAPLLQPPGQCLLLDWTLTELDRKYGNAIYSERLEKPLKVFEKLPIQSGSLKLLRQRWQSAVDRETARKSTQEKGEPAPDLELEIDSAETLEERLETPRVKPKSGRVTLLALAQSAKSVGSALKVIDLVMSSEASSILDKLYALQALKETWAATSVAVQDSIEGAIGPLADQHAADLIGSEWQAGDAFWKLVRLAPDRRHEVAARLIGALRGSLDQLEPADWLRWSIALAGKVNSTSFGGAIARFANKSSADIPDDFGDGPWTPAFDVGNTLEADLAAFVWHQLGSPHAATRWRAAHALRRFAALGEFSVFSELFDLFDKADALPFGDQKLPFYHLHAKLWLLLAVDRIAVDYPNRLLPLAAKLQAFLERERYHALLRSTAFSALSKINSASPTEELSKFLLSLPTALVPLGSKKKTPGAHRKDSYQARPDGSERPADDFYLDYDFEKGDVDRLGRVFGVDTWKVHDAVVAEMRAIDPLIKNMHACPRALGRYEDGNRFNEGYGTYVGNHALQTVAGRYLQSMPVEDSEWSWEVDPWGSWMRRYSLPDAHTWASDATDLFPSDLPDIALQASDKKRKKTSAADRQALVRICNLPPGMLWPEGGVRLAGHWQSGEETTVDISSVVVSTGEADRFATALFLVDPQFQFVPSSEDAFRLSGQKGHFRQPLVETHAPDGRIDDGDPYGHLAALYREQPSDWLRSRLDISASRDFERRWLDSREREVLRLEYWGARFGRGRHGREESGHRITCTSSALTTMLHTDYKLVSLLKVERYFKGSRRDDAAFARRSAVVVTDSRGVSKAVSGVPRKHREKWAALDPNDRTFLEKVYEALQAP